MPRLRTLLEWSVLLIPLIILGFLAWQFVFSVPASVPSGLPDTSGVFSQSPLSLPQQYTKTMGPWQFTLTSGYSYTLAGRIVGKHEYPPTPPHGIIALDLAVVNGNLINKDILSFFTFEMGDHTLKYSYNIPNALGLTEAYIDEHISNNHLVFLNSSLEQTIRESPEGSCMIITGNLVDIRGTSAGQKYLVNTSTVRNDGYPEGCEIILVESFTPVACGDRSG